MKTSQNQKLNFSKNLVSLTPRSKAMFEKMMNPSKQKLNFTTAASAPKLSASNLIDSAKGNDKTIPILTEKEIQDILAFDQKSHLEKKLVQLSKVRINKKSPRTRQAMVNLGFDCDRFSHFSFEDLYNSTIGRGANIRKFLEYLLERSNEYIKLMEERRRIIRLERDLNKKLINESAFSSNFSNSIFNINKNCNSVKSEGDANYYDHYISNSSKNRLNLAQKDFDVKILENRKKFLQVQNKIERFFEDIEAHAHRKKQYYKNQKKIHSIIENNKHKHLSSLKSKAQKIIINSQNKNELIQQYKKERDEELYERFNEIKNQKLLDIQRKEEEEKYRAEMLQILDEDNKKKQEIKEIKLRDLKREEVDSLEKNLAKINEKLRKKAEMRENHLNSVSQKMKHLESPEKHLLREKLMAEAEKKEIETLAMHLSNLENKINQGKKKYEQRLESIKNNIEKKNKEKEEEIQAKLQRSNEKHIEKKEKLLEKFKKNEENIDKVFNLRKLNTFVKKETVSKKTEKINQKYLSNLDKFESYKKALTEKDDSQKKKVYNKKVQDDLYVGQAKYNSVFEKIYREHLQNLLN